MPARIRQEWQRYLKVPVLSLVGLVALCLVLALVTIAVARVSDVQPTFFGRSEGEPSRIVVLVHGTFAPRADWTQPNAPLVKAIAAAEPANSILFVRFDWPGSIGGYQNNTNYVRYGAGQRLSELLWQLNKRHPHSSITVVAHSHGGNVALYAARHTPKLAGIVLMGTPFITVSPRNLTDDLALSAAISLLVFLAILSVEILSGIAGLTALAVGVSALFRGGVFAKPLGALLILTGLGLCFWMVEPDGSEQVWVPGTYSTPGGSPSGVTSSGHYETRTKWKQSQQADDLEASFKSSALGYVGYASREGGTGFATRMTTTIPSGIPALCLSASPPDEAMRALNGALPIVGAPSTILNSAFAAQLVVTLAAIFVIGAGLIAGVSAARSALSSNKGEGATDLLPAAAGGVLIALYTSAMAAFAIGLLLPFLALFSVVLRIPAAVPYMISYGSLDVIANLASTTGAQATPSKTAADDGTCELRKYAFRSPKGLRHSEYYLDRQSTTDVAGWIARHR